MRSSVGMTMVLMKKSCPHLDRVSLDTFCLDNDFFLFSCVVDTVPRRVHTVTHAFKTKVCEL